MPLQSRLCRTPGSQSFLLLLFRLSPSFYLVCLWLDTKMHFIWMKVCFGDCKCVSVCACAQKGYCVTPFVNINHLKTMASLAIRYYMDSITFDVFVVHLHRGSWVLTTVYVTVCLTLSSCIADGQGVSCFCLWKGEGLRSMSLIWLYSVPLFHDTNGHHIHNSIWPPLQISGFGYFCHTRCWRV